MNTIIFTECPKKFKKKYEILRWFWDIVFLQFQQLAQVCNENVLVGTDILNIKITPKLLTAIY